MPARVAFTLGLWAVCAEEVEVGGLLWFGVGVEALHVCDMTNLMMSARRPRPAA